MYICMYIHVLAWHDSFVSVTWLIHVCDMTSSCTWHDSFIYMQVSINLSFPRSVHWIILFGFSLSFYDLKIWYTYIRVTWLIYMCDMTHLYVRHDSLYVRHESLIYYMCDMNHWYTYIQVTWLIYMCDMTHLYVRHDSSICATWLIYMCDMTHLYVRHDSSICATWIIHIYRLYLIQLVLEACVEAGASLLEIELAGTTWRIHMCDMTHWHDSSICATWLTCMCVTVYLYSGISLLEIELAGATWLIHMSDMAHPYVRHASFVFATWLIHMCDTAC